MIYEAYEGRDQVREARNDTIAKAIVDGLAGQNISVSESSDILYRAQDMVRGKSQNQALSDLLKAMRG